MTKTTDNHTVLHYLVTVLWYFCKNTPAILISVAVALGGYLIFRANQMPLSLVLGLPLILTGLGFIINKAWSIILVISSPVFNRSVCVFCRKPP